MKFNFNPFTGKFDITAEHAIDSSLHTLGSLTTGYIPFASSTGNVLQNSILSQLSNVYINCEASSSTGAVQIVYRNNATVGLYKYCTFGVCGNSFPVPAWNNSAILESATIGGLGVSAYDGDIKFYTSTTRPVRAIITKGGNFGIGTSAPANLLHLYSSANAYSGLIIDCQGTQSAQQSLFTLLSKGDGSKDVGNASSKGWVFFARGDSFSTTAERNNFGITSWNGTSWATPFGMSVSGDIGLGGNMSNVSDFSGASLVVKSGNVGIGTASPTSKLQVVGLPVYLTNALAIAGGLTAGAFYRTGADPDLVCVVH